MIIRIFIYEKHRFSLIVPFKQCSKPLQPTAREYGLELHTYEGAGNQLELTGLLWSGPAARLCELFFLMFAQPVFKPFLERSGQEKAVFPGSLTFCKM